MAEWSSCFSFASLLYSTNLESSTVCRFIYRDFLVVWLNCVLNMKMEPLVT